MANNSGRMFLKPSTDEGEGPVIYSLKSFYFQLSVDLYFYKT